MLEYISEIACVIYSHKLHWVHLCHKPIVAKVSLFCTYSRSNTNASTNVGVMSVLL